MKKPRRSKEEIELEKIEKQNRKVERAARKTEREKEKAKKKKKEARTEQDIVRSYANRVMQNQLNHGRVDHEKFTGLTKGKIENKNLWMDIDFYFSVVFESARQKYEFLEKLNIEAEIDPTIPRLQIINGVKFAESLGIKLEVKEKRFDYPTADLDLKEFVLDNEIL